MKQTAVSHCPNCGHARAVRFGTNGRGGLVEDVEQCRRCHPRRIARRTKVARGGPKMFTARTAGENLMVDLNDVAQLYQAVEKRRKELGFLKGKVAEAIGRHPSVMSELRGGVASDATKKLLRTWLANTAPAGARGNGAGWRVSVEPSLSPAPDMTESNEPAKPDFFDLARRELDRAASLHGKRFASLHEGYAVLLEEVDELWDGIKVRAERRDPHHLLAECVQVAAMAAKIAELLATDLSQSSTEKR